MKYIEEKSVTFMSGYPSANEVKTPIQNYLEKVLYENLTF
jgi:hypothetical protein